MARIKVDTGALRTNLSDINSRLQELQGYNSQLETMIRTIESLWEGKASEAYAQMMRNYLQKAKKQENVLQEFKKYIQSAITKFETVDKNAQKRIENSF